MINAKDARELADNIKTKAAQEQLELLNDLIREAAAKGLLTTEVVDIKLLPCVEHYLKYQSYTLDKVLSTNNYPIKVSISW
jgi:hypothetical protein